MTARGLVRDQVAMQPFDEPEASAEVEELGFSMFAPPRRWRSGRGANVAAIMPLAVSIVMLLVPGYFERLVSIPPDMIGIPFGLVLFTSAILWSLLGAAVIGQTRYRVMAALALTTTTIPAVAFLPLIPTLIRILMESPG